MLTNIPYQGQSQKDAQKTASVPIEDGTQMRGKVSIQDIVHLAETIVARMSRKIPVHVPPYCV